MICFLGILETIELASFKIITPQEQLLMPIWDLLLMLQVLTIMIIIGLCRLKWPTSTAIPSQI